MISQFGEKVRSSTYSNSNDKQDTAMVMVSKVQQYPDMEANQPVASFILKPCLLKPAYTLVVYRSYQTGCCSYHRQAPILKLV
jgi:hypothetical protein